MALPAGERPRPVAVVHQARQHARWRDVVLTGRREYDLTAGFLSDGRGTRGRINGQRHAIAVGPPGPERTGRRRGQRVIRATEHQRQAAPRHRQVGRILVEVAGGRIDRVATARLATVLTEIRAECFSWLNGTARRLEWRWWRSPHFTDALVIPVADVKVPGGVQR